MRASDLSNPEQCKIPNNSFYPFLQDYIIDIIKESPGLQGRKRITKDLKYSYKFTRDEENFFKNYMIFSNLNLNKLNLVKKYFKSTTELSTKISQTEVDFLEIIEKKPSIISVVLGEVGWGKSTTLKHFFFYLIPKYGKALSKKILPIYIDLQRYEGHIRAITKLEQYEQFVEVFYHKIIKENTKFITSSLFYDENFWEYLKNEVDLDIQLHEEFLNINYPILDDYKKELMKYRLDYFENSEILFPACGYLGKKLSPIFLIDNSDPLPLEFNNMLTAYLHSKCKRFNLLSIICMRPNTFYELAYNKKYFNEGHSNFRINLPRPNAKVIVRNGMDILNKSIKQQSYITLGNIRIASKKGLDISNLIFQLLLSDAVIEFFDKITVGDLDVWAHLLKVYCQSGYLNEHVIFRNILLNKEKLANNPNIKIKDYYPQWIAYASIITHNYKTYFRNHIINRPKDTIINLFSNRDYELNNQLIRLHILNYFKKDKQFVSALKQNYSNVFDCEYHSANSSINFAIRRLVNCGLVTNSHLFKLSKSDEVNNLEKLEISSAGRYYLDKLVFRFEYLQFMKDGCDIDSSYNITPTCFTKNHVEIFNSVLSFIKFIFELELELVKAMSKDKVRAYKEYFAPSDCTFNALPLANHLRRYLNSSYIKNSSDADKIQSNDLNILIDRIENENKKY